MTRVAVEAAAGVDVNSDVAAANSFTNPLFKMVGNFMCLGHGEVLADGQVKVDDLLRTGSPGAGTMVTDQLCLVKRMKVVLRLTRKMEDQSLDHQRRTKWQ